MVYLMAITIAQLFDLKGKGAVVTGGNRGIGRGIAYRLAEAGAGVMIAARDMKVSNEAVEKIKSRGGKAQAIKADVCSAADAERVVQATVEAFGNLDILVNNAGIYPRAGFLDTTEEIWDSVMNTNLKGVFLYSQAAARAMIKGGKGGRIINMASIDAMKTVSGHPHYSVSKSGLVMLTKVMALELGPYKILVNAVAPGVTETPGAIAEVASISKAKGITLEQVAQDFLSRVPIGRLAAPDDAAKVVLFLASGAADYVTGELIIADGGYILS